MPFIYLGISLVLGKSAVKDCLTLSEKITTNIANWKNNTLSNAGRLELVESFITSFLVY